MKLTFNADPVLGQGDGVNLELGLTLTLVFLTTAAKLTSQSKVQRARGLRGCATPNLLENADENVSLVDVSSVEVPWVGRGPERDQMMVYAINPIETEDWTRVA